MEVRTPGSPSVHLVKYDHRKWFRNTRGDVQPQSCGSCASRIEPLEHRTLQWQHGAELIARFAELLNHRAIALAKTKFSLDFGRVRIQPLLQRQSILVFYNFLIRVCRVRFVHLADYKVRRYRPYKHRHLTCGIVTAL